MRFRAALMTSLMQPAGRIEACPREGKAMHRLSGATLALVLLGTFGLVPSPAIGKPSPAAEFTLGIGDELFWDGEEIDLAEVPDQAQCGVTAKCYEYELEVATGESGTRLRVALSAQLPEQESSFRPWPDLIIAPAFENVFTLQLFAPGSDLQEDDPVAQDTTYNGEGSALITGYAIELFVGGNDDEGLPVSAPEAGKWTIRVIPQSVVDMAFRMRAKLEAPAPDPQGVLPPNLRVIPPFELGFPLATAQGGPGLAKVPQSRSCMASEVTEPAENDVLADRDPHPADVPTLCLRYSMGLENAGDGLLRLLQMAPAWSQDVVEGAGWFLGLDEIPLVQQICNFRGADCEPQSDNHPVGRFHARHAHYHFQNAFFFQLYEFPEDWKRSDPQPKLNEVGEGRKMGVQPTPETMADWGRFYHLPRKFYHSVDDSGCGQGGSCGELALQAGWGDAYEWNRDGNYVNFPQSLPGGGIPKEGFYLLRGTADFASQVVESNEDDNSSYAFFEVSSNGKVELIERGYGTDPWDPSKLVLTVAP